MKLLGMNRKRTPLTSSVDRHTNRHHILLHDAVTNHQHRNARHANHTHVGHTFRGPPLSTCLRTDTAMIPCP